MSGAEGKDSVRHRLRPGASIPQPVVPANAYDEDYYRSCCAGAHEWSESEGAAVAGRYLGSLRNARLRQGDILIDIGTGRGELLAVAVQEGAKRAVGVEYSEAAVTLALQTIATHGVAGKAEVILADARRLPIDDCYADLVTMLDVVEHLSPDELDHTLTEARRVLRPGGRIVVHTFPSRTIYNVTYRLQRWSRPNRWRSWPANPRTEFELKMHVNEQTAPMLRRALKRAGFQPARAWLGQMVYAEFVPKERARKLYRGLARLRLTRRFGVSDVWAEGTKPA